MNRSAQCWKSALPPFNSVDAIDMFYFEESTNTEIDGCQQFYIQLLFFGIYSASMKRMMVYMWHELIAKKEEPMMSSLVWYISCTEHT